MDNVGLNASIRFAGYTIGGVLLLVFGIDATVGAVTNWAVQCSLNQNQSCAGNQIWDFVGPAIGGVALLAIAVVFFVLAHRVGTASRVPAASTPWPPGPPP